MEYPYPDYQSEDTYSAGTHTFNVSGEYIITPSADVTATVKMWGAGGGGSGYVNDTYGTGITTSISAGLGLNHNGLPPYDDDSDYPANAGRGGYGIGTSFRPAVVTQSTGEDGYNGYDGAVVIIIS
jgi:hypothetical protein